MPDLRYPRFKKWYNTTTWISRTPGTYLGHIAKGGRNFYPTSISERDWHLTAPPTRSTSVFDATQAFDLTTPAYMLADTDGATATTEDTLVGLDYYNPPIDLYQDAAALNAMSKLGNNNHKYLFARVLAINHQFTFQNNSRFPLEIYYTILPVGYLFNVMPDQYTGHNDMVTHTFKKIVVPAIQDANDRGQKRTIDVKVNLQAMFPDLYQMKPGIAMTGTTVGTSTIHGYSPWLSCDPSATANAFFRNVPPGQFGNDAHSTPDLSTTGPVAGLRMQWYAKLQQPRDVGLTTEDADHSGGDYTGNNYDVHLRASWLVDLCKTGNLDNPHLGEKAYPNNVA